MAKIRIAIAGVGNCASSLLQGIEYYRNNHKSNNGCIGLMHYSVGGYTPADIEPVAAFDVDKRKVGKPLNEAIFALPNNTKEIFRNFKTAGPVVQMGPVMDGVSEHMSEYSDKHAFRLSSQKAADIVKVLKQSKADILINYLPVGSQKAAEFYAQAALDAGLGFVNCIPVFIVSDKIWGQKFKKSHLPCIGDDIKSQLGATILHRNLAKLFCDRGIKIDSTYQLNTGGNTDFLNMLNRHRLKSKKISKTMAVQSQLNEPLPDEQVHIGPADYVPWQKDNKVCFLRIEGRGFANIPLNLELRLSVEDSPNSAGVAIDAIRFCKLGLDKKIGGPLLPMSSYFMKHPPVQISDISARQSIEKFLLKIKH
ncbi:MAG: inositol-3-phosphate synthase [Planctomycetes bacterium GWF2_41_51]|nr:MAG: inositol-3-phosphate synthase [Planctomycetes bacterium GWF2_41_51]HBG27062.1 inositol-3-phosphate synthase [Phycisphaerales bacterium]